MALVLRLLYEQILEIVNIEQDQRYSDKFLMGSPLKIGTIIVFYLSFVNSYGRHLMANRKPFQIDSLMAIYNIIQVGLNGHFAYLGTKLIINHWNNPYDIRCVPVVYNNENDLSNYEAFLTYYFYLLKVFDLLDTIFFILRKKFNQITFLHVYHHAGMAICANIFVRYLPGGQFGMLAVNNSYVHTAMYFYYLLSIFSSRVKNSLRFKKCITKLQLLQFLLNIICFVVPLLDGNCGYPKFWLANGILHNVFMLVLFCDFYIKAYLCKSKIKVN